MDFTFIPAKGQTYFPEITFSWNQPPRNKKEFFNGKTILFETVCMKLSSADKKYWQIIDVLLNIYFQ